MRFLDARDLGVGGGPGEIDGAGVDGFGVACPAGARGVRGDGLEREDVSVVPAADGGWEDARGVNIGPIKLLGGLKVVVDGCDWHDDGLHHGRFGGVSRCDAGGGAHGGSDVDGGDGNGGDGLGSSVMLKLEAITVELRRG